MDIPTATRFPNIVDDLTDETVADLTVDYVDGSIPGVTVDNIRTVVDTDRVTVTGFDVDPGTGETLAEITVPVYGYATWTDEENGGTVYAICLDCREAVAVDPDNGIPDPLAAWSRHGTAMDMEAGFGGGTCAAVEWQYRRAGK